MCLFPQFPTSESMLANINWSNMEQIISHKTKSMNSCDSCDFPLYFKSFTCKYQLDVPLKLMNGTFISCRPLNCAPFTGSDFLYICIYICASNHPARMDICTSQNGCYTLMCGISFKIDHIYLWAPNGRPTQESGERWYLVFSRPSVVFFRSAGFPTIPCVLWVRFTSASNCLPHADFSNSSIKAGAREEWPELSSGSCYFCQLDL